MHRMNFHHIHLLKSFFLFFLPYYLSKLIGSQFIISHQIITMSIHRLLTNNSCSNSQPFFKLQIKQFTQIQQINCFIIRNLFTNNRSSQLTSFFQTNEQVIHTLITNNNKINSHYSVKQKII